MIRRSFFGALAGLGAWLTGAKAVQPTETKPKRMIYFYCFGCYEFHGFEAGTPVPAYCPNCTLTDEEHDALPQGARELIDLDMGYIVLDVGPCPGCELCERSGRYGLATCPGPTGCFQCSEVFFNGRISEPNKYTDGLSQFAFTLKRVREEAAKYEAKGIKCHITVLERTLAWAPERLENANS